MQSNSTNPAPKNDLRIVVFSNTTFGTVLLDVLAQHGTVPVAVVTAPDKPAERGQCVRQTPIKSWAMSRHLRVFEPAALIDRVFLNSVRSAKPDIFVIASFGNMLPQSLLDIPPKGTLNIHPSLLPAYRGPAPIQAAILNGDKETGVTIMLTDNKMDHGPILAQRRYALNNPRIIAPELEKNLAVIGAHLLLDTFSKWQNGIIRPVEQDHAKATYTKLITKKEGRVNWREDAVSIERKIRAYQPWPGVYAFWQETAKKKLRLIFYQAKVIAPQKQHAQCGSVFADGGTFAIMTPREALRIMKVKPEGGRIMSGAEFLRGRRQIIGAVLS